MPRVLDTPSEGGSPKSVYQGGEPPSPFRVEEVQAIDALLGEGCHAALHAFLDSVQTGGVHQSHVLVVRPKLDQFGKDRMTEPHPAQEVGSGVPDHVDDRAAGIVVLQVDGKVELATAAFEQVSKGGKVCRQLGSGEVPDPARTKTGTHGSVMVDNRDAVRREPHVGLEAGGTKSQCKGERLQRVLRGVRPAPAVRETDGAIEEGGKTLLHQNP